MKSWLQKNSIQTINTLVSRISLKSLFITFLFYYFSGISLHTDLMNPNKLFSTIKYNTKHSKSAPISKQNCISISLVIHKPNLIPRAQLLDEATG